MTPASILDVSFQLLSRIRPRTRENLVRPDRLLAQRLPRELNTLNNSLDIRPPVSTAGVEVVVVNLGHVQRVGGPKAHKTSRVAGVSLEDGPGPEVGLGNGGVTVARVVPVEVDRAAKDKRVEGAVRGGGGLGEHGGREAVGGVGAAVTEDGTLPFVKAGVVGGVEEERAVLEGVVGTGSAGCHRRLVVVLEVGADTRKIDEDGDVERFELVLGANARELEKLGRVVGAAGENDLSRGAGRPGGSLGSSGQRAGAVEVGTVEELHTNGPGRGRLLVEDDLGDMAVEANIERVLLAAVRVLGVPDGDDKLAGSETGSLVGANGDLVVGRLSITETAVRIEVACEKSADVQDLVAEASEGRGTAGQGGQQLRIFEGNGQGGNLGGEPTISSMSLVKTVDILLPLHPGKVLAHIVGPP